MGSDKIVDFFEHLAYNSTIVVSQVILTNQT